MPSLSARSRLKLLQCDQDSKCYAGLLVSCAVVLMLDVAILACSIDREKV